MIAMEYLTDPTSCAPPTQSNQNSSNSNFESQSQRQQTRCKRRCCGCVSGTSLKCIGICFTGTLLLVVGTVLIAIHFTVQDDKTYLIPALVLFILGIIFISIAEWVCRVKLYHRYGRNHQRTLERLTGIERRLNRSTVAGATVVDVPPPYEVNEDFAARDSPTNNRVSITISVGNLSVGRSTAVETVGDEAPSYSVSVLGDVLPTYQEATSSEYTIDSTARKGEVKNERCKL